MKFLISTSICIQCYVFILEKNFFIVDDINVITQFYFDLLSLFSYSNIQGVLSCHHYKVVRYIFLRICIIFIHLTFHVPVLVLSIYPTHVCSHIHVYVRNKEINTSIFLEKFTIIILISYTYIYKIYNKVAFLGTKSTSKIVTASLRPTLLLVVDTGAIVLDNLLGSSSFSPLGIWNHSLSAIFFFENPNNQRLHTFRILFLLNLVNSQSTGSLK